ncbi:hypothetical protein [Vibrio galatheae]|uniref:hypothetical protein n=1 Tax=Vibrio galatheae TaxID=579748 RepID=UPI001EF4972B|nr:hypothetical protein [Vibrio galatheae]
MESSNVIEGDIAEIPAKQRRPNPLSLQQYAINASTRDEAITMAFASGGYTRRQLGDFFGLHYSRISRIVAKGKTWPL